MFSSVDVFCTFSKKLVKKNAFILYECKKITVNRNTLETTKNDVVPMPSPKWHHKFSS